MRETKDQKIICLEQKIAKLETELKNQKTYYFTFNNSC